MKTVSQNNTAPGAQSGQSKINLADLADSFVGTDTAAIRDDVRRLGSIEAAADYSADMSAGQPEWESLDSDEGREALRQSIARIVTA